MLLFKNAFSGLKENKGKTAGVALLVFLACFLFALLSTSVSALKQSNDAYYVKQNVYDFTIMPKISGAKDISEKTVGLYNEKMAQMAKANGFRYELRKTSLYEFEKGEDVWDFLLAVPQTQINKPYVIQGRLPEKDGEVTVSDQYAKSNHLKIGDSFDINGEKFTITGFAYQPDMVYPVTDEEVPEVIPSMQSVVFVTGSALQRIGEDINYTYCARFNDNTYSYNKVMALRNTLKADTQYVNSRDNKINKFRTDYLYEQIQTISIFAVCFLAFLFLITAFALAIILRKKVEADQPKLGQLKAMGYSNLEIAASYIPLALAASVAGGVLGYGGGYFAARQVVNFVTSSYIELPVSFPGFSVIGLAAAVLVPFVLFSLISCLIALLMIRKPTLELIYENREETGSALSRKVAGLLKNRSFMTQFKFGSAAKSPGRLLGIFLIMLAVCVMLIVGLIIANMIKRNVDVMVSQVAYTYEVDYDNDVNISDLPVTGYFEPAYNMRLYAQEGIKANGQKLNYYALNHNDNALYDFYVDVNALVPGSHLLVYNDLKTGKPINEKITGNRIGISAVVSQILNVGAGDSIVFNDGKGTERTYRVAAVSDDYGQTDIYANLNTIQNDFAGKGMVNVIYTGPGASNFGTKDITYVAVAGDKEVKNFKQTAILPSILTVAFAVVLLLISFIVLLILANIIIDENRKSISLLRVLGYTRKEISYMVVDIYSSIIVIAYFAALPVALAACRLYTGATAQNTYISYPVGVSPLLFIAGGLGLFLCYKIAIRAARRNIKGEEWKKDVY